MYENRNSVERFLVVHGRGAAWAMRAEHVVRFITLGQWRGAAPLTAQWCGALPDAPPLTRCLLVFRSGSGEAAVELSGTVTASDLDAHQVSPLPAPCQPRPTAALVVSAIAIDGDEALFLIVEPTHRWAE